MTVRLTVVPQQTAAGIADSGITGADAADTAPSRSWITRGACLGRDPDELFVSGAAQRDATRVCRACPVRLECLADALDNQVEFGVWGGLTERQRRALLRQQPNVRSWREYLENARRAFRDTPVAS